MVRLFILLAAVALVLLILALIACLSAERVRGMPRLLWVLVVLLLPLAGPIAYFLWGRPSGAARRPAARPSAPDDDPDFLRSMDTEQSRRDRELLARWERELRQEEEPPAKGEKDGKPQARDEDRG
ncbi:PLDc N-terminal domain-containing protein [Actinoplanes siamensis]|uniref:Cardiolipin synthase N-terminal domain-containing protein n=1 Tax=Actinoplanes siamensis TaxID=1223317 RepID=A0A919K8P1_9ACTN|nr:PLDc N-terminal domain-containing protein [Actinoplanes siamensis]GIF03037.1 hypothetical protein Asi03nite_05750 [Actinoplanes siamensis]